MSGDWREQYALWLQAAAEQGWTALMRLPFEQMGAWTLYYLPPASPEAWAELAWGTGAPDLRPWEVLATGWKGRRWAGVQRCDWLAALRELTERIPVLPVNL